MSSGHPLLYLSLPGVAFILGVFWLRRRNKNRLDKSDDESAASAIKNANSEHANEPPITTSKANGVVQQQQEQQNGKLPTGHGSAAQLMLSNVASQSMNINGSLPASDGKESPNTMLYGKSAPIKIQSNGRTTSGKHQQQIDSEMLKSKIQDAENKKLCSIDEDFENLSSPRDLPDSVNNRVSFYNRKQSSKMEEPVVIKATRTPKISPENSFLESKYTKECEQNNNCQPIAGGDDADKHKTAIAAPQTAEPLATTKSQSVTESESESQPQPQPQPQSQSQPPAQEQPAVTDVVAVAVDVGEQTTLIKDDVDANGNQKRTVDSASPSLSICSVQSGDSGKGSSLPRSEVTRAKTSYEFFFPDNLIGQLYGRKQTFINRIKSMTSANVMLSEVRCSDKVRICIVEGTETEIDAALKMIRLRLPLSKHPHFTMQRIHYALPQTVVPLSAESLLNLELKLIEGINNDIVVSAVLSGSHIFVQHPLHPSHPSLPILQKGLFDSYSKMEAPGLPGIELSAVCVISINDVWYRVQIVDTDAEDDQRCIVKFLDFGDYMNVHIGELKQIRTDFLTVPFQATECILSNIEPIDETWSTDAADILKKLTIGIVLQAQVAGYNSHNIPEIYLFATLGPNNVVFINKELVARNLARWVEMPE